MMQDGIVQDYDSRPFERATINPSVQVVVAKVIKGYITPRRRHIQSPMPAKTIQ
jgi:hypothetical protein